MSDAPPSEASVQTFYEKSFYIIHSPHPTNVFVLRWGSQTEQRSTTLTRWEAAKDIAWKFSRRIKVKNQNIYIVFVPGMYIKAQRKPCLIIIRGAHKERKSLFYHEWKQQKEQGWNFNLPRAKFVSNESGKCRLLTQSNFFFLNCPVVFDLGVGEEAIEIKATHVSGLLRTSGLIWGGSRWFCYFFFFFAQQAVWNANLLLCYQS